MVLISTLLSYSSLIAAGGEVALIPSRSAPVRR